MSDQGSPWTNLTHVGLVVRDLDKAVSLYETLGAGPFKRFRLPGQNFEVKFRQPIQLDSRHFQQDHGC